MSLAQSERVRIAGERELLRSITLADELQARLESMILIQMEAYPDAWSQESKREMAVTHLWPFRAA